jgi:glyoxylate/succinic semialdehyde reductase
MKLVVNMVMGNMLAALGEGVALAQGAALDPQLLLQILDLGAMANPLFKAKGPAMIQGTYPAAFPLTHAAKDMVRVCCFLLL